MALKFRYKAKEEVPAEALALYTERDGAFVLDVEGAVDKARVDEFRANNIALTNQLTEQKRRFESIESEQVKAIAAERDGLNAKLTAIQVDQGVVTVATKKVCVRLRFPKLLRGQFQSSAKICITHGIHMLISKKVIGLAVVN